MSMLIKAHRRGGHHVHSCRVRGYIRKGTRIHGHVRSAHHRAGHHVKSHYR
jgi:hypothetical protein